MVRVFAPTRTPTELLRGSLEYFPSYAAGQVFPLSPQEKTYKGRSFRINERGTRGNSFVLPKPEGVTRVVVLGGSSVFDVSANEGEDWPALVQKLLEDRDKTGVELINAGTPGHMSWNLLGRLAGEIWLWEPDYVVFYLGWNDLKYYRWLSPESTLLHRPRMPAVLRREGRTVVDNVFLYGRNFLDEALFRSQLYVFLRTRVLIALHGVLGLEGEVPYALVPDARRELANFEAKYGSYGPRQFELNLDAMLALVRAIGAVPVLFEEGRLLTSENEERVRGKIRNYYNGLDFPALLRAYAEQARILKRLAKKHSAPLLVAKGLHGCETCFVDQVHTTSEGSRILARALADFLESKGPVSRRETRP